MPIRREAQYYWRTLVTLELSSRADPPLRSSRLPLLATKYDTDAVFQVSRKFCTISSKVCPAKDLKKGMSISKWSNFLLFLISFLKNIFRAIIKFVLEGLWIQFDWFSRISAKCSRQLIKSLLETKIFLNIFFIF